MALSMIPVFWNLFQSRHGKSCVDCLASVWRRLTDDYNGQNTMAQLLYAEDIAAHWAQLFQLSHTSGLSAFKFDHISTEQLREYRADPRCDDVASCPGIARAHCFAMEMPQIELDGRKSVVIRVQGLSGYRRPDTCPAETYRRFTKMGFARELGMGVRECYIEAHKPFPPAGEEQAVLRFDDDEDEEEEGGDGVEALEAL